MTRSFVLGGTHRPATRAGTGARAVVGAALLAVSLGVIVAASGCATGKYVTYTAVTKGPFDARSEARETTLGDDELIEQGYLYPGRIRVSHAAAEHGTTGATLHALAEVAHRGGDLVRLDKDDLVETAIEHRSGRPTRWEHRTGERSVSRSVQVADGSTDSRGYAHYRTDIVWDKETYEYDEPVEWEDVPVAVQ